MATDLIGVGGEVIAGMHETSVAAAAAQSRAMVEARFLVALRRPRDIDDFRARLLKDCQRPKFAEVAIYKLPRGGKTIEGPSIRFIEAAVRAWGNVDSTTHVIYEDEEKMILRAVVTDLETNATYSSEHRIAKTVERRQKPKNEASIVGQRINSYGDPVFIVPATDDELMQKINAIASRAIRTNGLRLIPGDIVEEAVDEIQATLAKKDAQDPDAARKKIADAFAQLNIKPSDLREYLGHPLDQCSPAQLADLRAVYAAIRDGQTTWRELVDARRKEAGEKDRDETKVDDRDLGKLAAAAAKRCGVLADETIEPKAILAAVATRGNVGSIQDLPKADLPAALKAIAKWQPEPADGGDEPVQGQLA